MCTSHRFISVMKEINDATCFQFSREYNMFICDHLKCKLNDLYLITKKSSHNRVLCSANQWNGLI